MNFSRGLVVGLIWALSGVGGAALADDAATIRATSQAFVTAFNQGDAQAVAAMWAPEGELVDAAGRVFKGRAEIEAAYKKFFAEHPGEKIKVSLDSIQLLSEDAALEQGTASLESAAGVTSGATYTAVHVEKDGKWSLAFVHESNAATSGTRSPLEDLDWLVGRWTSEEYGATTTFTCRWLPSKRFLERRFTVQTPNNQTIAGVQIVGLDSRTGNITSWSFNSDGSHATGTWKPTAQGWAINSLGQLPDGTDTHAVNLLSKLDENAYSWQSVQRSVGLEPLPDTGEVILKRVAASKPANQ